MAVERTDVEGPPPSELEARAAGLVRCAFSAISLGTLGGAALVPALASSCCRRAVLHVDIWVWVAMAICTLCYFWCIAPSNDEESYHPLSSLDEERPALQSGPGRGHYAEATDCSEGPNGESVVAVPPEKSQAKMLDAAQSSSQQTDTAVQVREEETEHADVEVQTDAETEFAEPRQANGASGSPSRMFSPPRIGAAFWPSRWDPSRFQAASRRFLAGVTSSRQLQPGASQSPASPSGSSGWSMSMPNLHLPRNCQPSSVRDHVVTAEEHTHDNPESSRVAEDEQEIPASPARRQDDPVHSAPVPDRLEEIRSRPLRFRYEVLHAAPPEDEEEMSPSPDVASREASRAESRAEADPEEAAIRPTDDEPQALPKGDNVRPLDLTQDAVEEEEVRSEHAAEQPSPTIGLSPMVVGTADPWQQSRELRTSSPTERADKLEEANEASCCCGPCCACFAILGLVMVVGAAACGWSRPEAVKSIEKEGKQDLGRLRREAGPMASRLRDGAVYEVGQLEREVGIGGRDVVKTNMPPHWYIGDWGICSTECGNGTSSRLVYCVNGNDTDCELLQSKVPSSRPCTDDKGCKWNLGQWGKCDVVCGVGHMTRNVSCATGEDCHDLLETPPTQTTCEQFIGCEWDVQPWEECSNDCGNGTARRTITCKNGPLKSCLKHSTPPAVEKPCYSNASCTWDGWGTCSNTCGIGSQRRKVEEDMIPNLRLHRTCHDVTGCEWRATDWSDCTTTCGIGTHTRDVSCANGNPIDCLEHSPMPPKTERCAAYHGCSWTAGEWGYCISQCGVGLRRRSVTCANGKIGDCRLGPEEEPEETKPCYNISLCSWKTGPWSPCSNVCGEGRQYRMANCGNGQYQDCRAKEAPPIIEQQCVGTSGCLKLKGRNGCECFASDPLMLLAGALNAVTGWSASFAVIHKLVSMGQRQLGAATLLSAPAVLIAGLGALAAASVLQSESLLPNVIGSQEATFGRKMAVTPGVLGLAVWSLGLCSLCLLGRAAERCPSCALVMVLLSFCGMVLFMASGSSFDDGGLPDMERARRLVGDLVFT